MNHIKLNKWGVFFLFILYGIWISIICCLYYSCNYKTGWFSICLSEAGLMFNILSLLFFLFFFSYLILNYNSFLKILSGGMITLTIHILFFYTFLIK